MRKVTVHGIGGGVGAFDPTLEASQARDAGKRPSNCDLIRRAMKEHDLKRADIAQLVRASPLTVKSWLRDADAAARREAPHMAVELLYLKLNMKLPKGWPYAD